MRSWHVRTLGRDDARSLSALLSSVSAPGPEVVRAPDPFAHPEASGAAIHVGAFHDDTLVAAAGAVAQMRHVGGKPQRSIYVFDVRVAPHFRQTLVLAHLLKTLRAALAADDWCLAVVLEGHPLIGRLARGVPWFGEGRVLGRTRHLALPASSAIEETTGETGVEETDVEEAAGAYFRLAPEWDLSPADPARFRATGRCFVRRRGSRVTAVGKLVDEAPGRRILRDGTAVPLAYLSSYASEDGGDPVAFALGAAAIDRRAAYVCVGLDASAPARSHPLAVTFISRTYGYGRVPPRLAMRSHELTWM